MDKGLEEILTLLKQLHISTDSKVKQLEAKNEEESNETIQLGAKISETMKPINEKKWNQTYEGIKQINAILKSFHGKFILLNVQQLEGLNEMINRQAKDIFKDQFELETQYIGCKHIERYQRIFNVDDRFVKIECNCDDEQCKYQFAVCFHS